jgi:hypothetical protein
MPGQFNDRPTNDRLAAVCAFPSCTFVSFVVKALACQGWRNGDKESKATRGNRKGIPSLQNALFVCAPIRFTGWRVRNYRRGREPGSKRRRLQVARLSKVAPSNSEKTDKLVDFSLLAVTLTKDHDSRPNPLKIPRPLPILPL